MRYPLLMKNYSDGDNGNFDIVATKFTVHRIYLIYRSITNI